MTGPGKRTRTWIRLLSLSILAFAAGLAILVLPDPNRPESRARPIDTHRIRLRVAVLGDSDSHLYRDHLHPLARGGEHHQVTHQWTEVWDLLRADEVDQGRLGIWGSRRGTVASLRSLLGLTARLPRKRDFEYNYAVVGAGARSLADEWPFQLRWLRERLQRAPEDWRDGLVVIRIGVNDFGQVEHLERWGREGLSAATEALVDGVSAQITAAAEQLLAENPRVLIALVGIAHDYLFAPSADALDADAVERAATVLRRFDQSLQQFAASRARVAFVEDVTWHQARFGGGAAARRSSGFSLGGSRLIRRAVGDHPENFALACGHAGTVSNGLWLSSMTRQLNDQLGLGLTPLLDLELADLVDPDGSLGIAPPRPADQRGRVVIVCPDHGFDLSVSQLPHVVTGVSARAGDGDDISRTLTAWLEGDAGRRSWLFGDGDRLRLESRRHRPGVYSLVFSARDRFGNRGQARATLTIRQ